MNAAARKFFAADLIECLRLSDARKAENAAARVRMQNNVELRALLAAEAKRQGQAEIDWAEYFRTVGV